MRMNPIIGFAVILAVGLVALPALAATAEVEIRGGAYHPAALTVESNTTVTWTNYDGVSHSVTSAGGLFDSGPIEQNETFDYTFIDPGTYPYGCTINASTQRTPMQGVVIVVPEGMAVEPGENVTGNMTLADLVGENENLTTFAGLVETAGLTETVLSTGGPYTVFAPSDAAFEGLDEDLFNLVSNDTEMLDALLMHHVVRGNYTVEDLNAAGNETALETLSGENLTVEAADGSLAVENATIAVSDLVAENGVIHIIDVVLLPPGLAPPAGEVNVTIIEPMEGAGVPAGNVTVSVNVTNFTLVEPTGQPNAPGEGHLHYYLDAPIPTNESVPAIPPTGGYVVSTNLTHTWGNVTAGEHNLSVQVVNNDHTPLIPLVFDTVNITVEGNETSGEALEARVIP
ncbi:fasciclin domain-containing protein [Methanoculleus sp. DTU007]|jgi:uncharacterized surface protein with fasciclin (FAS1) repeats/plastocyanin|uniref:fasciclin domain-containing protein n=1 Tax=Methanoculleus TaxID=45989 RepID=UPI000B3100C8|nr:fasciclin domain-containing protein [Methanoculleus sp. DTU007]HQD25020.1 fasciclin domain-containing protein [Methanoculleus thermophilus]